MVAPTLSVYRKGSVPPPRSRIILRLLPPEPSRLVWILGAAMPRESNDSECTGGLQVEFHLPCQKVFGSNTAPGAGGGTISGPSSQPADSLRACWWLKRSAGCLSGFHRGLWVAGKRSRANETLTCCILYRRCTGDPRAKGEEKPQRLHFAELLE